MTQYTNTCPFCMKIIHKSEISDMTLSFDKFVGEKEPQVLKVCKPCKKAVDYIGLHATGQRQDRHFEAGNTPSKEEDLGPVCKRFNGKRTLRVDTQEVEHKLCKCCLVWKPTTTDYFAEKHFDYGTGRTLLDDVCHGCREISFRTLPSHYLTKVKAKIKQEIKLRKAKELRAIKKRQAVVKVLRKNVHLVQYVDGGGLISIHTTKDAARKEANALSLKHDPEFRKTGMKSMFKIAEVPLRHTSKP